MRLCDLVLRRMKVVIVLWQVVEVLQQVIAQPGYGHITPKTMWGMIVTIVYAVFGIPLTVLTLAHLGRIMATAFRFIYRHICCCFACRARDTQRPKRPTDATNTKETTPCVENGNGGDEKPAEVVEPPAKKNLSEVKVPICVTIMVLVVYIAIGSLLFTLWEGWSIVEASYFCFITLSTIGFGDFVPGTSLDAGKSHEKLLCCAVYLLLGLSFLMMCFDLIQEQVVHKFQSLGKCIGLVKDEEKPEEE